MKFHFTKNHPLICLLGLIGLFSSCESTRYYRSTNLDTTNAKDKSKFIQENLYQYSILRQQNQAYGMTNILMDSANLTMSAMINPLAPDHAHNIRDHQRASFKSRQEFDNEMHIYASDTTAYEEGQLARIEINDIEKITLIEFDSIKTNKVQKAKKITGITITGIVIAGVVTTVILFSAY